MDLLRATQDALQNRLRGRIIADNDGRRYRVATVTRYTDPKNGFDGDLVLGLEQTSGSSSDLRLVDGLGYILRTRLTDLEDYRLVKETDESVPADWRAHQNFGG